MSTKWNKNFEPGFIQCLDLCSGNVCKLEHIKLDSASFAYLNIQFQKTHDTMSDL